MFFSLFFLYIDRCFVYDNLAEPRRREKGRDREKKERGGGDKEEEVEDSKLKESIHQTIKR